jgi:hypothetical protein
MTIIPRGIAAGAARGFILREGRSTRHPAIILVLLIAGCGGGPSISSEKVAEIAENYTRYADAVDAVQAEVKTIGEGLRPETPEPIGKVMEDLGAISQGLRADAANIKTAAVVERVEKLGTAIASVPHPFAKVGGWALAAGALIFGLAARKKKPPLPSGPV